MKDPTTKKIGFEAAYRRLRAQGLIAKNDHLRLLERAHQRNISVYASDTFAYYFGLYTELGFIFGDDDG
jgi:hypothetical protein